MFPVKGVTKRRSAGALGGPAEMRSRTLSQEPARAELAWPPTWPDFPSCGSHATAWDGSYRNGYVFAEATKLSRRMALAQQKRFRGWRASHSPMDGPRRFPREVAWAR